MKEAPLARRDSLRVLKDNANYRCRNLATVEPFDDEVRYDIGYNGC